MAVTKDLGAHAADGGDQADGGEAVSVGDLVELHDGAYAIVVEADPARVLMLGQPVAHELPVRKVI